MTHAARIDRAIRELTRAKESIAKRDFNDAAASMWIAVENCSATLNKLEDSHGIDGESLCIARRGSS